MEVSSVLNSPSQFQSTTTTSSTKIQFSSLGFVLYKNPQCLLSILAPRSTTLRLLRTSAVLVDQALVPSSSASSSSSSKGRSVGPKVDKTGKFSSPRAARELALSILYAASIEGSDPVHLFEERLNARREPGFEFDKAYMNEYNPMNFGGSPVTVETTEEAERLQQQYDKETLIEIEVLAAPPKMVYNKLMLRSARNLLVAVAKKWDSHVLVIDKIAPVNFKNEAAGKILELCIMHLAMSEIAVVGTAHQVVVNEAVDLAKRFCDGAAPRVINGCLRTFVKDVKGGNGD